MPIAPPPKRHPYNQWAPDARALDLVGDEIVLEAIGALGMVFVALDVGQFLWAEVTPDAVQALGLAVGQTLTCLIKVSAMRLVR